jgi:hypothetical protein
MSLLHVEVVLRFRAPSDDPRRLHYRAFVQISMGLVTSSTW